MKLKVSVIMPVLNGERFIGEAVASIAAQTYRNIELVLVDDGSTDASKTRAEAAADGLEIRHIRHEKPMGIPVSMNDGVRHATGDLIAFLDHDDAWMPDFAATQVAWLEAHPDTAMVHSDFQTIDVVGNVIEASVAAARGRKRPSGNVFPQLFMDSFIVGNSVMIRRECFNRLGLFDESLRWGDYHMWLRIARHYRVDYVDHVLTKYRQHPTQSTRSTSAAHASFRPVGLQAIEKLLAQYPEIRRELGSRAVNRRIAAFYFDVAYGCYAAGDRELARAWGWRALRLWPSNTRYMRLLAATALGAAGSRTARQVWLRLHGQAPAAASGVRGLTR